MQIKKRRSQRPRTAEIYGFNNKYKRPQIFTNERLNTRIKKIKNKKKPKIMVKNTISIDYNPFTIINQNITPKNNTNNYKDNTPRTRYNIIQNELIQHSLNVNTMHNSKSLTKLNSNINTLKNILPDSSTLTLNELNHVNCNDSLSFHTKIQNNTTLNCLNLLKNVKQDVTTPSPITLLPYKSKVKLKYATKLLKDFYDISNVSQKQKMKFDNDCKNIERWYETIHESKELHKSKSHPNLISKDNMDKNILNNINQNKKIKKSKSQFIRTINTTKKPSNVKIKIDQRLNELRNNKNKRETFNKLIEQINKNKIHRLNGKNYISMNKKTLDSCRISNKIEKYKLISSKYNEKKSKIFEFLCEKENKLKLKKIEMEKKIELDRINFEKQKKNRNSVLITLTSRKHKEIIQQQQLWFKILYGFNQINCLSKFNTQRQILKINEYKQKQINAVKKIVYFYKKYIVELRKKQSINIMKKFQQMYRVYNIQLRFNKSIESCEIIIDFLFSQSRFHGLERCINSLNIYGRAKIIQKFWRKKLFELNIDRKMLYNQYCRIEIKYINKQNSKFGGEQNKLGILRSDRVVKRNKELSKYGLKKIDQGIGKEYINKLFDKMRKEYYFQLKKWLNVYNKWEIEMKKYEKEKILKQQLGIKMEYNVKPPLKPKFKPLIDDDKMYAIIEKLYRNHVLNQAKSATRAQTY